MEHISGKPAGADLSSLSGQEEKPARAPSNFVAIGASAGGLEAIEAFFKNMPENSGMAFIVVQHLSPDHKSLMVELLSKRTSMRVRRAEEGTRAAADQVYLIPPKKNLRIFHGKLLLDDQSHNRGVNLPIDIFLRSLAEDQGEKAVGIILSGAGSDGMRGIRSIKEHGGMVMVQDEGSAKFDGMPKSAISTGLADFILAPDEMPKHLLAYAKHPYVTKTERSETILTDEDRLTRVFSMLRDVTKVDFTFYKPSTVVRRIERRMTVNQVHDLKDYVRLLETDPGEIQTLYRELLIGVTSFFRDREAFRALEEKYLPKLIEKSGKSEFRFWTAGCSTGEEAYTVAILFRECIERLNINTDIKIFATDIDRNAIVRAGAGEYPESIAADLPPGLLSKYFYKKDDNFQISRNIREMVVFARHNLIKDPPFTNIDLVSCRNLLIYLQPVLQKKVLEQFNFSLNADGLLLLGSSETTGEMSTYFEALDHRLKIYRCMGKRKPAADPMRIPSHMLETPRRARRAGAGSEIFGRQEEERILERYVRSLSPDFVPLSLIVNERMEVLHVLGDTEGFFRLPAGKIVNDISKMAARDLAIPLNTGIRKIFKKGENVTFSNIRVKVKGAVKHVRLRVRPLDRKKGQAPLAAVFIEELKVKNDGPEADGGSCDYDADLEIRQRVADLEQELQFTRENLQAAIEELETSNEELQAANEELLASNEELQSTNEELQSVNEELYTVNAEYQSKIMELTELNNDMDNFLNSTRIGALFLDEFLEIRKFTPETARVFKIVETDMGRPITHLSHNLADADPVGIVKQVRKTSRPVEQEVRTRDGDWLLMRALPYFIAPGVVSGVVAVFTQINRLKQSEQALVRERDLVKKIMETSPMGITMVDSHGRINFANSRAEEILGLTKNEISKRYYNSPAWQIADLDGGPFPEEKLPVNQVKSTGKPVFNVRHAVKKPGGGMTFLSINAAPLFDGDKIDGIVCTIENLTGKYRARKKMEQNEHFYRKLFDKIHLGVAIYEAVDGGNDFVVKRLNRAAEKMENLKSEQVAGRRVGEIFPGIRKFGLFDLLTKVHAEGGAASHSLAFYEDDRNCGWRKNHVFKMPDDSLAAVYTDESDSVTREKSCGENEKNIRTLIEGFAEPAVFLGPGGTVVSANNAAKRILQKKLADFSGKRIFDFMDGEDADEKKRTFEAVVESKTPRVLISPETKGFFPEFIHPVLDDGGKIKCVIWAGVSLKPGPDEDI